jgi:transcriptional regulator with XRE-family HTH domain
MTERKQRWALPGADEADWVEWMRQLGKQKRRVREMLGLSQDEVARRAGVSQGAVSRLEAGRGVATPLVVVMKVDKAMREALMELEQEHLSSVAKRWLEFGSAYSPSHTAAHLGDMPVLKDEGAEQLLRSYRKLPSRLRGKLLDVVRATVDALDGIEAVAASGTQGTQGPDADGRQG